MSACQQKQTDSESSGHYDDAAHHRPSSASSLTTGIDHLLCLPQAFVLSTVLLDMHRVPTVLQMAIRLPAMVGNDRAYGSGEW